MGDDAVWAGAKILAAMELSASLTKTFRAIEAVSRPPALQVSLKALGVLRPTLDWSKQFKALELEKLTKLHRSSTLGLLSTEALRASTAIEAITKPVWMDGLKAVELGKTVSNWASASRAIETTKFESVFPRYAEALEALTRNSTLMKAMETPTPSGLRVDRLHELLRNWQTADPMSDIGEAVEALSSDELIGAMTDWAEQSAPKGDAAAEGGAMGRSVPSHGSVSLDDVQAIVDRVVNSAMDRAEGQVATLIASITEEVRSLKSGSLKAAFLTYILPILIAAVFAILNPIADYYVKGALEDRAHRSAPREVKKKIRRSVAIQAERRDDLRPYRIVSRRELSARANPSSRSGQVTTLELGQAVLVLRQQKDWSLVAWEPTENSPAAEGWVFTRYVTKIV